MNRQNTVRVFLVVILIAFVIPAPACVGQIPGRNSVRSGVVPGDINVSTTNPVPPHPVARNCPMRLVSPQKDTWGSAFCDSPCPCA